MVNENGNLDNFRGGWQSFKPMTLSAETISQLFGIGMIIWLSILAAYILFVIISNKIPMGGLIQTAEDGAVKQKFIPERVASLVITLAVAGFYIITAFDAELTPDPSTNLVSMPDIPEGLLALLVGGKTLFIAGKIAR